MFRGNGSNRVLGVLIPCPKGDTSANLFNGILSSEGEPSDSPGWKMVEKSKGDVYRFLDDTRCLVNGSNLGCRLSVGAHGRC